MRRNLERRKETNTPNLQRNEDKNHREPDKNHKGEGRVNQVFRVGGKNPKHQPRFTCPVKLSSKSKGEVYLTLDKEK